MSAIYWLASYPKSGNTWLRVFLANLRRGGGPAVGLNSNDLNIQRANSRQIFDDAVGVESSDLTEDEIAGYRPHVYRYMVASAEETLFLKVHDAYTMLPQGKPLIPAEVTAGAVYVVRNPLDVAVSFAHYSAVSVDRIISVMASDYRFSHKPSSGVVNERLLSWSGHVLSWTGNLPFGVHVIRYEDMHEQPLQAFTAVARFCGLSSALPDVERALQHSSFQCLQAQEREEGFHEKPESAALFFREGRMNTWRDVLSNSQIERIVQDHGAVMERFGYAPL